MSIKIIKAGIFDSVQDKGRLGYQHLGINPGGVMDGFSAQLANAILGKEFTGPILELHFPASKIKFTKGNIISISGADFSPSIDGVPVELNHPLIVKNNSVLEFKKRITGTWCYIAFFKPLNINKWLGSYSTHLKVAAGGNKGRLLETGDVIEVNGEINTSLHLNWKTKTTDFSSKEVEFITGSEWNYLSDESKFNFEHCFFCITSSSDRMGYRLSGVTLDAVQKQELLSSAVSMGTVQLLPNGQLIVLMADHQTTGGYPKVAHVVSSSLSLLAQKSIQDIIDFKLISLAEAEENYIKQQRYLQNIKEECKKRMITLGILEE
jgi:antagonist of KipI